MRLPTGPDLTPTHVWNPLAEDYTTTFANDENVPIEYTCPAQTISTFPAYIASHIAKKLASKIVLEKGVETNYEDEYNAQLAEILVKI